MLDSVSMGCQASEHCGSLARKVFSAGGGIQMLKATVVGSFHRHLQAISQAVDDLRALGVQVLAPAHPDNYDYGEILRFMLVSSDRVRAVKIVENRQLQAIAVSDFL